MLTVTSSISGSSSRILVLNYFLSYFLNFQFLLIDRNIKYFWLLVQDLHWLNAIVFHILIILLTLMWESWKAFYHKFLYKLCFVVRVKQAVDDYQHRLSCLVPFHLQQQAGKWLAGYYQEKVAAEGPYHLGVCGRPQTQDRRHFTKTLLFKPILFFSETFTWCLCLTSCISSSSDGSEFWRNFHWRQ